MTIELPPRERTLPGLLKAAAGAFGERPLMSEPRLLMLDEPSLGLAPLIVRDILAIVRTLRDDGVSILLVEQNARAALETSDHGYVLETGEIAFAGASAQLAGDPRVQATYLGGGTDDDA